MRPLFKMLMATLNPLPTGPSTFSAGTCTSANATVVVDDALYVRGYNGTRSRWYQAALRQKAGRISAAGTTQDVAFEPVDGAINDRIDEAYRTKYRGNPYLEPMIGQRARAATVRISPLSPALQGA